MKNFYIDNNQFDAEREAANSEEAVRLVFGAKAEIREIGFDDDRELFYVTDDEGEEHEVFVTELTSSK